MLAVAVVACVVAGLVVLCLPLAVVGCLFRRLPIPPTTLPGPVPTMQSPPWPTGPPSPPSPPSGASTVSSVSWPDLV